MLNGKSVLVTGGTGSFGKAFIQEVLQRYPDVKKVVVYSRDELKQFEMSQQFSSHNSPVRFLIGDVRDLPRLTMACENIDVLVHTAALKQVPTAEYNPMECVKTNIIGAQNVIDAALMQNIESVVALSTDKAAAPINLYGATKLCSDKLFISANNIRGERRVKFSVVRYGNVMGSRGSVFPFFLERKKSGVLPITDKEMTRFNITLKEGAEMVLYAIANSWGGELFVPKIPSYKLMDVAEAIAPECERELIGIRPGEKLHEEMIMETDALGTLDCGQHYVILPSSPSWDVEEFKSHFKASFVDRGFKYNSATNNEWLDVHTIRRLIREHIDPEFELT